MEINIYLSVGLVSESHSLLIRVWWSSLPRASAIWTLDSVPIFKFLCFRHVMVLVPPFLPLRFTRVPCSPEHLARILSFFFQLHPLRPFLFIRPTTSSSVCHPLSLRQKSSALRLTANQCPLLVSYLAYASLYPTPTCAAGGTWLGCGWRGEGDGAHLWWSGVPRRVGSQRPG